MLGHRGTYTKVEQSLIAIVDDEEALREATESLLRSAGFRAESFGSAEAFLRSGCRATAGCLLLDVGLPGMSGLELQLQLIRDGCGIPIVFMTAQYDNEGRMRERALRAGALAFLQKPFGDEDLLSAVRFALSIRGAPLDAFKRTDGQRRRGARTV
jgi:FixJ family two-component response regulator